MYKKRSLISDVTRQQVQESLYGNRKSMVAVHETL